MTCNKNKIDFGLMYLSIIYTIRMARDTQTKMTKADSVRRSKRQEELNKKKKKAEQSDSDDDNDGDSESDEMDVHEYRKFLSKIFPSKHLNEKIKAGESLKKIADKLNADDSEEEVEDVLAVLAVRNVRVPTNWSRRFKNHQEKMKSGDIYECAEVVRNLALRDRQSSLSSAEKAMQIRARRILVSELAVSWNTTMEDAGARVDTVLAED